MFTGSLEILQPTLRRLLAMSRRSGKGSRQEATMTLTVILIIGVGLIVIMLVIGMVITLKSDQSTLEDWLGQYLEEETEKESTEYRFAGDSSTDAPLPDGKVKKKKRKEK